MARVTTTLLVAVLAFIPIPSSGQDTSDVKAAMTGFLTAFNQLDWSTFQRYWDRNATLFGASASFPTVSAGSTPASRARRVEGAEVTTVWKQIFDEIRRRSGRTTPPYQNIQPQELRIDLVGADTALVTFHLGSTDLVSRRTFVWKRTADGWKIVHLHASLISLAP
jgi:hypothetical protein